MGRRLPLIALTALMLVACATPPTDPAERSAWEAENDPLEPLNREVFEVNRVVDGLLIKPAAMIYRGVVPEEGRTAVRNVLDNLKEPVVLANNLLQGDLGAAGDTVGRFAVNTTVGVLGIGQPAEGMGLPRRKTDFGTTLHVWGTGEGPYLILPILGPSNPRDTTGLVVDALIDPFAWVARANDLEWITWARFGLDGIDVRARNIEALDEIERSSLDFYAQIRSLARQRRAEQLRRTSAR